jgi:hypothetical protein
MQEGERRSRGHSKQQSNHAVSRSRDRQGAKAAEAADASKTAMKAAEVAEASRKASRKIAKARAKASAKANRKLSNELAESPALRELIAEGAAGGTALRRKCTAEEMATLSRFLSLRCPGGSVCKQPLLPIAIGAIPDTPHLTCGGCRMSFCGFEVLKCPPPLCGTRSIYCSQAQDGDGTCIAPGDVLCHGNRGET